jgi:sec-independent protein translocase protein TatA
MGSFSIWHWVIVALVVILLFGRGRISEMMGDLAKGIKSFRKGLAEEDTLDAPSSKPAAQQALPREAPTPPAATETDTQAARRDAA